MLLWTSISGVGYCNSDRLKHHSDLLSVKLNCRPETRSLGQGELKKKVQPHTPAFHVRFERLCQICKSKTKQSVWKFSSWNYRIIVSVLLSTDQAALQCRCHFKCRPTHLLCAPSMTWESLHSWLFTFGWQQIYQSDPAASMFNEHFNKGGI